MRYLLSVILTVLLIASVSYEMEGTNVKDPKQRLERTSFQSEAGYFPGIDIKSDVAIVYGIGPDTAKKIESWRKEGYVIHLMTGASWGDYQDYLTGKWDGKTHWDESQTKRDGEPILHGDSKDVPYMCPGADYGKYLCVGVKKAIDAGAEAIHMEEPEFWVKAGYSEAFKREWQAYYNEPWIAPHTSPDAQYRASKLKYYLYRRALQQVFDFIVAYSKEIGRDVKCYVPTHSMINYASWKIVSPEASLVQLPGCDGYIGQVWTGTARTANQYKGVVKSRTFETAFCEYGSLHNLVRSTGRTMWYLNDPVEDDGNHAWDDYRYNWECTLTASLLWPDMWQFEVMPWPSRVFTGYFPEKEKNELKAGEKAKRVTIPADYATEVMTVITALNDMKQPDVQRDMGTHGIGVLVADTMMFQRGDPDPSDPFFSNFYGLSLPLIKRGIPAEPVQYENAPIKGYLDPYKVLFLTYEGMKPPSPELHTALAKWVKAGGVLVFVDDDSDPYNSVKEWWNSGKLSYKLPRVHLFEQLGQGEATKPGTYTYGKGALIYSADGPTKLSQQENGDLPVVELAKQACKLTNLPWKETNYFILRRGPYLIAAGLDESGDAPARVVNGLFVDLFSPKLDVVRKITVTPNLRKLYLDVAKIGRAAPTVLASASKILGEKKSAGQIKFHSEGPVNVMCATRVLLPSKPKSVSVGDYAQDKITSEWDAASKTLLLRYPNSPDGLWVKVTY